MKLPKVELYNRLFFLIAVLEISLISQVFCNPAGKVVTIHQGDVRGRVSRTRDDRLFVQFYGIPYAKSPKRFQLSRPGPKWKGILEGSKKPPPCFFQHNAADIREGTEDCLFINVHTPQTHNGYFMKKLPVIVLIHGGFNEWLDQTGYYSEAKYFLDEDVIIVTFNYRLGPFGFFTTSDETIPANLGLKDQVLALKWVKKNIQFFGGDPNKVTIMGYGSGAASVYYHVLAPMSKGLFERAIAQSGNALCPWAIVDDPEKSFERFVKNVGCDGDLTSKAVVECLENTSAIRIAEEATYMNDIFSTDRYEIGNSVVFGPVVEHWMRNWPENPIFLHHYPQNLLANWSNETMSAVPLLIGVNEFDGVTAQITEIIRRSLEPVGSPNPIWNFITTDKFGKYFGYTNRANNTEEIDAKVLEFYFKEFGIKQVGGDHGMTFFKALGHRHFAQCTRATAVAHSKVADTFLYYFTYFRNVSFLDYWMNKRLENFDLFKNGKTTINGPVHGDELQYLFDLDEEGDFPLIRKKFREMSLQFSKSLVKLWVNFARTGKPATDWEPLPKGQDKGSVQWYNIGDKRHSMDEPFRAQVDFWESLNLDGLRELPELKPKNDTTHHRNGTKTVTTPKPDPNGANNDDIVYIDQPGDDDGTGGLFKTDGE